MASTNLILRNLKFFIQWATYLADPIALCFEKYLAERKSFCHTRLL
tara:strand:+ start:3312 stop:3449 length:138 start_codon:yes stop_codon:yes gene_type:complete